VSCISANKSPTLYVGKSKPSNRGLHDAKSHCHKPQTIVTNDVVSVLHFSEFLALYTNYFPLII